MSAPTSRTSRSPFARSSRSSAAVPGQPTAVTWMTSGSNSKPSVEVDAVMAQVPEPRLALVGEHPPHRLAHRVALEEPDLRMRQELQPLEPACGVVLARRALAPVRARVDAAV